MSQVTYGGGAPTGSGSSIVAVPGRTAQPVGIAEELSLEGTGLAIEVGPDVGTLYVGSTSGTNVKINSLSPGFDGQRLVISTVSLGEGALDFILHAAGAGPGQILNQWGPQIAPTAFNLQGGGDSAVLTYSAGDINGFGAGWWVNMVILIE